MNRLNKFVKSFLVASLSIAFLMPNAAITSNAAVQTGTEVSKYGNTDNEELPSNVLIETGTQSYLFYISGYKVKNVKSSSSNLKLFKRTSTYNTKSNDSNSAQTSISGSSTVSLYGYAKKAGTYKVTYNVTDVNGVKVMPTQTVTVVAKDDVSPFKKITYAGTSLWNNSGSRFSGLTDTTVYTTKKKGKLVVKPASGYKIKKIEVATYNAVDTKTENIYSNDYYEHTATYTTNKSTSIEYTNSDGVTGTYDKYDEYGNPITGNMTYKKVKSGKKITIGTTPYTREVTNITKYKDVDETITNTSDSTYILPATDIRVTYYDKTTKKTFQWSTTIFYVN